LSTILGADVVILSYSETIVFLFLLFFSSLFIYFLFVCLLVLSLHITK